MSHFSRPPDARPRVYGHRGTRIGAPENSLAAMRLALDQGADGIELDVRLCASGEPVVVHDASLERVARLPFIVAETPLSALRGVLLGRGQHLPTLDEAMALVLDAGHTLNIELKSDVPDIDSLVQAVLACVRIRSPEQRQRVLFSSFSVEICAQIALAEPTSTIALIAEQLPEALPRGCSAVHLHYQCAIPAVIAAYRAAGLIVNSWTVNTADVADVLARSGIDGIITDDVPMILAHMPL